MKEASLSLIESIHREIHFQLEQQYILSQ